MIFYFSGTGNSRWIAQKIAEGTEDRAADIVPLIKEKKEPYKAGPGEAVGFVFPVYAWGAPEILTDFARRVILDKNNYTFAACTCGAEAGNAVKKFSGIVPLKSGFSFVMPNNYVVASKVYSPGKVQKLIDEARERLSYVCAAINDRKEVMDVKRGPMAGIKSSLACGAFNKFGRRTDKFSADEKCTSCGMCAEICPAGTISIKDGRPEWGGKCIQCLACINRCPEEAIQYGKNSYKNGRYYFEKDVKTAE